MIGDSAWTAVFPEAYSVDVRWHPSGLHELSGSEPECQFDAWRGQFLCAEMKLNLPFKAHNKDAHNAGWQRALNEVPHSAARQWLSDEAQWVRREAAFQALTGLDPFDSPTTPVLNWNSAGTLPAEPLTFAPERTTGTAAWTVPPIVVDLTFLG